MVVRSVSADSVEVEQLIQAVDIGEMCSKDTVVNGRGGGGTMI